MNFVRFCELVVSGAPNIRCINLLTGMEGRNSQSAFDELARSLEKVNVVLKVEFSSSLHDREIRYRQNILCITEFKELIFTKESFVSGLIMGGSLKSGEA